jgi:hypothetical protein
MVCDGGVKLAVALVGLFIGYAYVAVPEAGTCLTLFSGAILLLWRRRRGGERE